MTIFMTFMLLGNLSFGADQAKITIKTVDEDGNSLTGMPVRAAFYQAYAAKGESDSNGLFVLEGEAKQGEANYFSQKEGYYRSEGRYTFSPAWSPKDGHFHPWNPVVTMIVRRVVNPIPMYAKYVQANLPRLGEPVGYDLMVGDWVAPNGKGAKDDIVFEMSQNSMSSWTNFTVSFDCIFSKH